MPSVFLEEKDETTVSGYVIYKTQVWNASNDVVLKTEQVYYWYVGHVTNDQFEDPNELASIVLNQNPTTSTTGPSTLTIPTIIARDPFEYVLVYIYPDIWGTPNIVDSTGYGTGDGLYTNIPLTPPTGYNVVYWDADSPVRGKTLVITWTK